MGALAGKGKDKYVDWNTQYYYEIPTNAGIYRFIEAGGAVEIYKKERDTFGTEYFSKVFDPVKVIENIIYETLVTVMKPQFHKTMEEKARTTSINTPPFDKEPFRKEIGNYE